jgi:hypothetical protein
MTPNEHAVFHAQFANAIRHAQAIADSADAVSVALGKPEGNMEQRALDTLPRITEMFTAIYSMVNQMRRFEETLKYCANRERRERTEREA